ncbi:MAG TPA: ATP-binding protein [Gammaproteobacteria bacterium]|nr:ATP-binding protein [Gammaproteobacteria bacterium]
MKSRATKLLMIVIAALLLAGLYLLARTTQNSAAFARLHVWLLLFNALAALVLLGLIVAHLVRLIVQYRRQTPGSRLTARLVGMFVLLAVLPVVLVYYFSVQFLDRGIDSWFDVRVEQALDDALTLSRSTLDARTKELLARTQNMARRLAVGTFTQLPVTIETLRQQSGASELTLFGQNGRILATSTNRPTLVVPNQPTDEIMLQLRRGLPYVSLDPIGDLGLHIRSVVPVPSYIPGTPQRYLQALFPVAGRQGHVAQSVQAAYTRYRELTYLRKPLKYSLILTLSLVLLLGLLAAIWGAFYAARRLVAPIQDLAEGTRAVARGDFTRRLPMPARDEVGFLVSSFNEMTSRLGDARETARRSQQQVESERAYLEAVLARLSSGVIALDSDLHLRTANTAATDILGLELGRWLDKPIADAAAEPFVAQFMELFKRHADAGDRHWREEIVIGGAGGRRILTCSCTSLPNVRDNAAGYVVVFDDLTTLIQAQRDAAWGEVARRLAHEIKNPLTPIQLAAERLRLRYLDGLTGKEREVFERATHTIVQQVDNMKAMVNAFSDYARTPQLELRPMDLNRLVTEIAELYHGGERPFALRLELDPTLPPVNVDAGRIGQMLHNLIRNAGEALEGQSGGEVVIRTRRLRGKVSEDAEITVADNGPGVDAALLEHVFEPYVTSKPKGTGLGLAIVKKLVEEHGGTIRAENRADGGASMRVRLPINERALARSLLRAARRHKTVVKEGVSHER